MSRGTPINVKAMVETLGEAGYGVDLLTYPYGEPLEIENVNLLRSLKIPGIKSIPIGPSWVKILLDIPFTLYAFYLSFRNKYDLVHGIEEAAFIAGIIGILTKKPFIYDMDSCMPTQLKDSGFLNIKPLLSFVKALESFFIKRSAGILTVCSALSDKAKKKASDSSRVFQIEDFPYEPTTELSLIHI